MLCKTKTLNADAGIQSKDLFRRSAAQVAYVEAEGWLSFWA